jgi:hypothetical protein
MERYFWPAMILSARMSSEAKYVSIGMSAMSDGPSSTFRATRAALGAPALGLKFRV